MNLFRSYQETFPIERIYRHIDSVVRTNYSAPGAVVQKIFAMSTEMEKGFLKQIDFNNKRVFTVGSSCDQVFEYALRGSRDITVMDANFLTPYFGEIKLAALKALGREDFISFFNRDNKEKFVSKETYVYLIRPRIQDEMVLKVWNYIFNKESFDIRAMFWYYDGTHPTYLESDENYEKLRSIIDQVSVKFGFGDISKFHELAEGEYDFIDLSNILTYFNGDKKVDFFDAAEKLHKFLSVNGVMKLHYGKRREKREPESGPQYNTGEVYNGTFMDKLVRLIPCDDNNLVIAVWDNDKERYLASHPKDEELEI